MRNGRLTVLEPIELSSVMRFNRRLRVVAHDRKQRRHVFFFRVRTVEVARSHEGVMSTWIQDRTSLAFVRGHAYGALVNMETLSARLA